MTVDSVDMLSCKDISQQGVLGLYSTVPVALCLIAKSPCAPDSLELKSTSSGATQIVSYRN